MDKHLDIKPAETTAWGLHQQWLNAMQTKLLKIAPNKTIVVKNSKDNNDWEYTWIIRSDGVIGMSVF